LGVIWSNLGVMITPMVLGRSNGSNDPVYIYRPI
jgi:hypothetical protein